MLEYSPSRAERLIATARVPLTAAAALAIRVDPTAPIVLPLERAGARRAG